MDKRSTCSIPDCDRDVAARGWCRPHWKRWSRHGDPLGGAVSRYRGRSCIVQDCDAKHEARGYCRAHYKRVLAHGTPDPDRPLETRTPREGDCSVADCSVEVFGRGKCWGHYYREWRYGDATAGRSIYVGRNGPCLFEGCERTRHGQGYCNLHHQRLLKGTLNVRTSCCVGCGAEIDLWESEARGKRKRPVHIAWCAECKRPPNPITTERLRERDGESCGICSGPVDMRLDYPDKMSASVDHVIPLAVGGDNTAENCALAHLSCNIRKRTRVGWTPAA